MTQQSVDPVGVTINLRSSRKTAHCPECLKRSSSVHSCRRRRIQHLPCSGRTLWLAFAVRHWYCHNPSCSRKIFAESLAPFAGSRQQSSQALQNLQRQLGLSTGGESGRRAATAADPRTSADTLLRRVVNTPETKLPGTPHVGIDEWAWHRGHRDGTLIVNLDTHRPLVLLPSRDQRTLAAWFRKYPEIQVVSRDRGGIYATAAREGAPQARLVADRWLQSGTFPEMSTRPPKPGLLAPWREWLEERRESGDHNASQIWREMAANGFTSSETTVRDEVAKWHNDRAALVSAPASLPSASRVSHWLMPWRIIRGEENYASRFIGLMCEKEPQLKIAQQLALDFYRILKTKNKPMLSRWFTHVSESGSVELQRVAGGMEADAAAICAAIISRWSNGVVEGHVNQLKMLKRQMYGRAGFELLRQRVMSPLA